MEDKLFQLMEKMYSEMQQGFTGIRGELAEVRGELTEVQGGLAGVREDLAEVKKRVINIENDHGKKLTALFDGYKQHSDQLDRIEKEVSRQQEVILRRIK